MVGDTQNSADIVIGKIRNARENSADRADLAKLLLHLPTIAAVDMESAAVAQVCHEYSVPFTVVRTISAYDYRLQYSLHVAKRFNYLQRTRRARDAD